MLQTLGHWSIQVPTESASLIDRPALAGKNRLRCDNDTKPENK
jgi:hypothetical protein